MWFVFWPEAGVTVLNVVEQLVCESDPTLLAHLMRLRVTARSYVWPILTSAFSRVGVFTQLYVSSHDIQEAFFVCVVLTWA